MRLNLYIFPFLYILSISLPNEAFGQKNMETQLKATFAGVDTNSDGFLSTDEYLEYYETKIAPGINKRHADKGGDAVEAMHKENRKRFVEGPFGKGDKDGDKKLTFDEYDAYHKSLMNPGK